MTLLEEQMETCTMYDKTSKSDGYGGFTRSYVPGAQFLCAVVLDTSMQARVAEKQGVKALYTATTSKAVNLQFHDVFKRDKDGKTFRVTSDGDDKATPNSANLDMRQVSCEQWEIPKDEQSAGT